MRKIFYTFALLVALVAFPVSAQEDEGDKPMSPEELKALAGTMPDAFEQQVKDAGGNVSYVFGEERPFPQCHASTIAEADDGTLLCAWFGGLEEKADDVGIWLSRKKDDGWSDPKEIAKVNETPHWNPVLFAPGDGNIYLFFKIGPEIPFWQTYWMTTSDAGQTWSTPEELVPGDEGGRGPVKNKPVLLSNGWWLAGASTEYQGWDPFADISKDKGETWERSPDWNIDRSELRGKGAIQPTVWESKPGYVHALLRTTHGMLARADSSNYGKTWTRLYLTDLPNPNSGVDLVKLEDGRLLLVYNPTGKNWGARTPLTLSLSTDNGRTWKGIAHLETEAGEYSYPAIVETEDGVAISYTWRRERIRVWEVPSEVIPEK